MIKCGSCKNFYVVDKHWFCSAKNDHFVEPGTMAHLCYAYVRGEKAKYEPTEKCSDCMNWVTMENATYPQQGLCVALLPMWAVDSMGDHLAISCVTPCDRDAGGCHCFARRLSRNDLSNP